MTSYTDDATMLRGEAEPSRVGDLAEARNEAAQRRRSIIAQSGSVGAPSDFGEPRDS